MTDSAESQNPLRSLDDWEDFVEARYPRPDDKSREGKTREDIKRGRRRKLASGRECDGSRADKLLIRIGESLRDGLLGGCQPQ